LLAIRRNTSYNSYCRPEKNKLKVLWHLNKTQGEYRPTTEKIRRKYLKMIGLMEDRRKVINWYTDGGCPTSVGPLRTGKESKASTAHTSHKLRKVYIYNLKIFKNQNKLNKNN